MNATYPNSYTRSMSNVINFGKHKGVSLREIARIDPQYITYLLTMTEYIKPAQRDFILKELILDLKLGFGKYENETFGELLLSDPKYLEWMAAKTKHTWVKDIL